MSRKRILNITSEKKQDTMMIATNVTVPRNPASNIYGTDPAQLSGGTDVEYAMLWCATARDNATNDAGGIGTKFSKATRTASQCYMRGVSEKIELVVSDNLPWQWRRICFTYKQITQAIPATDVFRYRLITSEGYRRVVNEIPTGSPRNTLYDTVFDGERNVDWVDPMIAKIATDIITVKYDKTITLASQNEAGFIRAYKRWHPMNSNLNYADNERGGGVDTSSYASAGKAGMGDYFILDLFRPRTGSTSSNRLLFRPQASLYWHER